MKNINICTFLILDKCYFEVGHSVRDVVVSVTKQHSFIGSLIKTLSSIFVFLF